MHDDLSDERLMLAYRDGDTAAFEALYARYRSRLYRHLVHQCGDVRLAEEFYQDIWLKVINASADYEPLAKFSTWLYRIAYNTFLNSRRRPFRIVPLEPVVEATAVGDDPPPDETAEKHESRDRLRRAVLALPEELRSVVTAHYWGEIPVAEIAKQEGMTPPGVRKRLARAFTAIQAALEGK